MKYQDLSEEQIKEMVQVQLLTDEEISTLLNCNRPMITRFKTVHGIHKPYHNEQWLRDQYKLGKTIKQIANELRVDREEIRRFMRRFNIKTDLERARVSAKEYHFDERIFKDIDTPEKAYWLGFITGDGCIEDMKRTRKDGLEYHNYRLRFTLTAKDVQHLEKFKLFIGDSTIPIKKQDVILPGRETIYEQVQMKVCCRQMCIDLMNNGIMPRKSMHEKVPNIDNNLISHFIRGEFDADGCISCDNRITIVGSYELMSWIQTVTSYGAVHHNKRDHSDLWTFSIWSLKDSYRFCNWIYNNQTICLERKYQRYLNFMSQYKKI